MMVNVGKYASPMDPMGYLSLGVLAHLLRMVMEAKYLAFRFGDCTPQSSSDKVIGSLGY